MKLTIIKPGWFSKSEVMTIRERKTGYPYLRDWRTLKAALSDFRRCRMEEENHDT